MAGERRYGSARADPTLPRDPMTSNPDTGIATDRRFIYQPLVLESRPEGYAAEEVNALLLGVEQEFETCLRQTEGRVAQMNAALRRSRDEMARLANLADERAHQDAARCAELDAARQEAESRLAEERAARHLAERQVEQIARLEMEICSLKSSTSWRVTKPLRWISRRFRRG